MRHQCSKSVFSWSDTCRHQHEDIQLVLVPRPVLGLTTSDSVLHLLPTLEIFTPPPVTVSIASRCARGWLETAWRSRPSDSNVEAGPARVTRQRAHTGSYIYCANDPPLAYHRHQIHPPHMIDFLSAATNLLLLLPSWRNASDTLDALSVTGPQVQLSHASVLGTVANGPVESFLGIPFAEPP